MICSAWTEYEESKKDDKTQNAEEEDSRIFKSKLKPVNPDSLFMFFNDEPMCISYKHDSEIIVQLE
eukprot:3186303-Karenia_brevis.AAC.1